MTRPKQFIVFRFIISMEIKDSTLEKIIFDIENSNFQIIKQKTEYESFELCNDQDLVQDLAGNIGAFFVRALLRKLKVNEQYVLKWRLENKYRQYQILNHYVPGCVAETISFFRTLSTINGVEKIKELCENGFFIKATLGHRTGNNFDRTKELDTIVESYQKDQEGLEEWMLQKKLCFTEEFRAHTFSKDLIYGLTFIMKGEDSSRNKDVEAFLKGILDKLPDTIMQGTLIGWDIGISDSNEFYVIEANFTGFHPEFKRGFQTSGYFGDDIYGSIMCAWLNNYFRINYHIFIGSVEPALLSSKQFYQEFVYYDSLIMNERIKFFRSDAREDSVSAIIYVGEVNDDLLIRLIRYLQIQDFATSYYLIINKNSIYPVINEFKEDADIGIFIQDDLFTEDQYKLVKQLSYERQKKFCAYHVLRIIKAESYFIV